MQKLLTSFSAKILAYMPSLMIKDDIISFDQLGPNCHHTHPEVIVCLYLCDSCIAGDKRGII